MAVNSKKRNELKQVNALIQKACKEKIERDRKRGILNRPVRAMIVGIPNVGKSSLINSLTRVKNLVLPEKHAPKPGTNRALQKGNSGFV